MHAEQHSPEFELQHKVQILAADSMVHDVVGYNNIIFSANEMLDIGRRDPGRKRTGFAGIPVF